MRGQDHLDVGAEHLRVDRRGALVLAVDELGGAVGHHVIGEGGAGERGGDLGAVGARGTLERVGEQQHAGIVHVHLVGVELVLGLDLLLERDRLRVLRVEPVIAVHDVAGGVGEFLHELVGRSRAAEHGVDPFRADALLLHGAREQNVFVVVVGRDHDVRILRADLERDIVEVAGGRRVRDRLQDLETALGQLGVEELRQAGAEGGVLMHDHDGLGRLAGLLVDRGEVVERGLGDRPEARAEAECVLEPAGDDAIDHAHVDHVGQVVARSGLARGEADRAGIAADDRGDAARVHLLDLGIAAFRRRLGVAQHRLDLGTAQRLDSARGVDLLDREQLALVVAEGRVADHRGAAAHQRDRPMPGLLEPCLLYTSRCV